MKLDPRDRRILKSCVAGMTLEEIARVEHIHRNSIKKRLDMINGALPKRYKGRAKRVLYPVVLIKYRVMTVEELVGLL